MEAVHRFWLQGPDWLCRPGRQLEMGALHRRLDELLHGMPNLVDAGA